MQIFPSVNFSLESFISQKVSLHFSFLLVYTFLGMVPMTVKSGLDLPKGHFERLVRSTVVHLSLGGNFLKNCSITFLYFGMNYPKEDTKDLPKYGFD